MTSKPYFRLVVVAAVLTVVGVLQYFFNIIPIRVAKESTVPLAVELPTEAPKAIDITVTQGKLPSSAVVTSGTKVRVNVWAWNAQMGLIFANGGPKTTTNSLMEQHGVNLTLVRQDDTNKSEEAQIQFAQALAKGDPNPSVGTHFVIIMGDQSAGYIAGINKALSKLGSEYRAEVVGAVGYSGNSVSGEDACMGLEDYRSDPSKLKGTLFAGAVREGDWNLCQYFFQQNGIKNNPDETTIDLDAVNWVNVDYVKAAELYINGACENRKVVAEGKITSSSVKRCITGVATWTPQDVNIAKKKGGLVKLISTKENAFQMPAVVIGVHAWNQAHAKAVEGFLAASFEGADQVRNFDTALQRAGKASYALYGEESAAYWVKYFKGSVEKDRVGMPIPLGGSRVANLGDNLVLFGLADGSGDASSSMFRASYEGFGNIVKQQYPKLVPDFPPTQEAVNTSFISHLASEAKIVSRPEEVKYDDPTSPITDTVAQRNWTINFETGKATFTKDTLATLDELFNVLSINKLYVQLDGHTDNTGSAAVNIPLSKARAQAVADYLSQKAPSLFEGRVTVNGFGDTKPIAPNTTPSGKALNRRVTVTIGNK
jgi:OOP family OmpA-OmpF porin